MGPYPLFAPDAPPTIPATKMYAYNAAGAIQYEGWATSSINPQPNQPVWAIKMYTYDGNNRLILEQWAGGSSARTNVWNNAATLTYQ